MRGFMSLVSAALSMTVHGQACAADGQVQPVDPAPVAAAPPVEPPGTAPDAALPAASPDAMTGNDAEVSAKIVCDLSGNCGAPDMESTMEDEPSSRGFSISRKPFPEGAGASPPAAAAAYRLLPSMLAKPGAGRDAASRKIVLAPGNGQLWMLNAFDFQACEAKKRDPWDHRTCAWSQYVAGDRAPGMGRYMYEVRWPDGKVDRGARVVEAPGAEPSDRTLVFKRD